CVAWSAARLDERAVGEDLYPTTLGGISRRQRVAEEYRAVVLGKKLLKRRVNGIGLREVDGELGVWGGRYGVIAPLKRTGGGGRRLRRGSRARAPLSYGLQLYQA